MASLPEPDSRPLENCSGPRTRRPEPASGGVGRRSSRSRADEPSIRYCAPPNATPEEELQTLERVLRFVLECYERRNSHEAGHGEVGTETGDAEESPQEPPAKDGSG